MSRPSIGGPICAAGSFLVQPGFSCPGLHLKIESCGGIVRKPRWAAQTIIFSGYRKGKATLLGEGGLPQCGRQRGYGENPNGEQERRPGDEIGVSSTNLSSQG